MTNNQEKISKLISFWLRHKPEEANLEIDEFGWVNINDLFKALNAKSIDFSRSDLIKLNDSFDKIRWKLDLKNEKIKATHGHSIKISQELKPEIPNEILYHGTATKNLSGIIENGLKSGQRQYVHLSDNIEIAKEIGKRHGKAFIIEIETKELIKNGWEFYKTEQNIWLTTDIPTKYLDFKPWHFKTDQKGNEILKNELKREVSGNHILNDKLEYLNVFGYYLPSDDVLLKHSDIEELYLVHPTWSGKKENDKFPGTNKYDNIRDWIENRLIPDQNDWY